jgi:chemotaxis protein MotA
MHPRMLEVKLKSFLTPSLRNNKLVSIERIREKLNIQADSAKKTGASRKSSLNAAAGS